MRLRLFLFLGIFTLLNLGLIPLMTLYGLSVCPILRVRGFVFGCAYAGTYVGSVIISNLALIYLLHSSKAKHRFLGLKNHPHWASLGCYVIASIIALIFLQWLFGLNHLSIESRAPEILALASFLLGITQTYGLSWVRAQERQPKHTPPRGFGRSWLSHTFRTMGPIAATMLLLLHFMKLQSEMVKRADAFPPTPEELLQQTSYIILFATLWLSLTYAFHFLSERDAILGVREHLKKLEEGDHDYRSDAAGTWGLWHVLLNYLNDFSTAFGERTRLLKSFSRFVTGEVAHQALKGEITATEGREEELTVIMSDIRDFTKLSSEMPAPLVVDMLNQYFTLMLDEMVKHSIVVDKFIGDGILAYAEERGSGSREANRRAVAAALGMLERLEAFNRDSALPPLKIGLGICRGTLIRGHIGSREKLQHTIIGDTVNRAARLESLCKELGVPLLITGPVWEDLEPLQGERFKAFESVRLKGIAKEVKVYGLSR